MRIGWIGTGIMGGPMAAHVQQAEYELSVYNRTRDKARPLLDEGATWCDSPAAVGKTCDIVFTIVGFPADVEDVYLGKNGILTGARDGACRIAVDMTTSNPSLAQRLADAGAERGVRVLDAPVSGGDVGAQKGILAIMAGGDKQAFEEILPILKLMGQNIRHMGPAGAGQHTKMCNQTLIAGTMIGVCESLLYASRAGLDQKAVIEIIGKGAASSWSINNLGPRIAREDYGPGFFVDHFVKDMEIALAEARRLNLALPGLALVHQLYVALQAQGGGRYGTQGLMQVLENLSGDSS